MPLYEYRCTSCGHSFEKIQKFSDAPETDCPKCHGVLVRPVTAPALKFEGAGWYVNDYAGKGAAKSADPVAAPTPASGAGESKTDAKVTSADSGASTAAPAAASPAATPVAGS